MLRIRSPILSLPSIPTLMFEHQATLEHYLMFTDSLSSLEVVGLIKPIFSVFPE